MEKSALDFLQTLAVVLCAAAVTTGLFQKLRFPVVLGYLLAGMLVGPHIPFPPKAGSSEGWMLRTRPENSSGNR